MSERPVETAAQAEERADRLSASAKASTFVRSFLIQGSWNYRTMIGGGMAFALLPVLRRIFPDDRAALEAAVARHAEHFNAHPYLAGVALGATARLEASGADTEVVRRFKQAIKGPLGGLGDSLVWAAWLPTTLLLALAVAWAGAPGWVPVAVFLGLYNAGHLLLRGWGYRVGLDEGRNVAARLREAKLANLSERTVRGGALFLGVLVGELLVRGGGMGRIPGLWGGLCAVAFLAGLVGGARAWRPAALATVGAIVGITLIGLLT